MRPDDILDGELSPSAPPSLSLVLDLLRRHVKARQACGSRHAPPTEDDLRVSLERAVAAVGAKDVAAQRKIRQLAQEGQALRRTIAALESQENTLEERLTWLRLDIEHGEKEASDLAAQLQSAAVEFRRLAEAAAQRRPEVEVDRAGDRVVRDKGEEREERDESRAQYGDVVRALQLCRRQEENFVRYAFAAAAASSHASIHSL